MILSFRTDMPGQTVQTQRVWSVSTLFAILSASFGLNVELHSSNFRVITTNVLGVRIFKKFTVGWPMLSWLPELHHDLL